MTIREKAIEWLQDHSVRSSTETCLLPQDAYERISDSRLRNAVDEFIGPFECPDRGEHAYAIITIEELAETEETLTCCVCGADIDPDSDDYECITTDHGPDHCCTGCEYTGDEE